MRLAGSKFSIGVVGATGALGKEILAVLDKSPWRPDTVKAYASAKSTIPTVDYGDSHLPVDDLADADFEGLDAVILAVPPDVARAAADRAVGCGTKVVDCSGALLVDGDVPLVVPWVNPLVLKELPLRGVIAIPHATAMLLASVLAPLTRAGLVGPVEATVMLPASTHGRDGVDELSKQVIALFNNGTAPRRVFEHGLAFDLLPAADPVRPDGLTEGEARAVDELGRLLPGVDVSVTEVGVPLFSGIAATLRIAVTADPANVARVLAEGGVQVPTGARAMPRPRRVDGHPFAHVGRIRVDGHGLRLWAVMDNLRGAAAVAVGTCGVLVRKPA